MARSPRVTSTDSPCPTSSTRTCQEAGAGQRASSRAAATGPPRARPPGRCHPVHSRISRALAGISQPGTGHQSCRRSASCVSPHSTHSRPKAETQSRPWASNVERGATSTPMSARGMMTRQNSGSASRLSRNARGAIPSNSSSCRGSNPSSSRSCSRTRPGRSCNRLASNSRATARKESQNPAE